MKQIKLILKIIIPLIMVIFIISKIYKSPNEEPINVYVEHEKYKQGVLVWGKQINFVDKNNDPDIIIVSTNYFKTPNRYAKEVHKTITIWPFRFMLKPAYIYVRWHTPSVMGHEFGHFINFRMFLDKSHLHSKDVDSIMCTAPINIQKPLYRFKEFKNKKKR